MATDVDSIIYRYLTDADFFNINKPPGAEVGGGGQSYIDFSTSDIGVEQWDDFLAQAEALVKGDGTVGPQWTFDVRSIGLPQKQSVKIFQRRANSVSVASQKLGTRFSNRILAWHPDNGFPEPKNPANRNQCPPGLVVYFARAGAEIWAGWFINAKNHTRPFTDPILTKSLAPLLRVPEVGEPRAGMFSVSGVSITGLNTAAPFSPAANPLQANVLGVPVAAEKTIAELIDEDFDPEAKPTYVLTKVRKRNTDAVPDLKKIYNHQCQITGDKFTFTKKDGIPYTEVHHLIHLGRGGADDPRNMIVVSAHIHKMLHFATVHPQAIDLNMIKIAPDGSGFLNITINGDPYTIRWRPDHAQVIAQFQE